MNNTNDDQPKNGEPSTETLRGSGLGGLAGSAFLHWSAWAGYATRPSDFQLALKEAWDAGREDVTKGMVSGVIDGGDTREGYLMIQVPVSPTGYRIGAMVLVVFPNVLITESSPKKDPQ
jgi:hypothetical protein